MGESEEREVGVEMRGRVGQEATIEEFNDFNIKLLVKLS